jgi:hypothetical protein
MKGIAANLLFAALFGLWLSSPRVHADTIYVSTANLNSILSVDSSGGWSTFATAGSGLNYPLGLAFNGSGNLYVANSGGGNGNSTVQEFTANSACPQTTWGQVYLLCN